MAFNGQDVWRQVYYGFETEFPPLQRAFSLGNYWFCENNEGEQFFRSRSGTWFLEDPLRKRIFIESDFFWELESNYGQFYGQDFAEVSFDNSNLGFEKPTRTTNNSHLFEVPWDEPWLEIHGNRRIQTWDALTQATSCPDIFYTDPAVEPVEPSKYLPSIPEEPLFEVKEYTRETSCELPSESDTPSTFSLDDTYESQKVTSSYLSQFNSYSTSELESEFETGFNKPDYSDRTCSTEREMNCSKKAIGADPHDYLLGKSPSNPASETYTKDMLVTKDMEISRNLLEWLIETYKDTYLHHNEWLQHFPWVAISKCVKLNSFFEFDLEPEYASGTKRTGYIRDLYKILTPGSRILISSPPGFGKTTLCCLLSQLWVRGKRYIPFKLCLKFNLRQLLLKSFDLSQRIVQNCRDTLGRPDITEEMVREALRSESPRILLLLDGLDELDDGGSSSVQSFLQNTDVFRNSSIIVTSRFSAIEKGYTNCFSQRIVVNRLTYERLEYLVRKLEKNLGRKKKCKIPKVCKNVNYLTELSPMFVYFLCAYLSSDCCDKRNTTTLYSLLRQTVYMLIRYRTNNSDTLDVHKLFLSLGHFFLNVLVKGQISFGEDLSLYFSKEQHLICGRLLFDCQIIYEERKSTTKPSLWSASSKLLMMFFAIYYLRHIWKKHKYGDFLFMSYLLLLGNNTSDITTDPKDAFSYAEGLLPGLILNLARQHNLANASIKMLQDQEWIEQSQAFDVVNFLVETDKKDLERYGFNEIPYNDALFRELEKAFEFVLHQLLFEYKTDDYEFYSNSFESKYYLKFKLKNSDDAEDILRAVITVDTDFTIESAQFDVRVLHTDYYLLQFLSSISSFYFEFVDIKDCNFNSVGDFAFDFGSNVLISKVTKPILISCTEFQHRFALDQKSTLLIYPEPGTKEVVCILMPSLRDDQTIITYDSLDFANARQDIVDIINSRSNYSVDSMIAIKITK